VLAKIRRGKSAEDEIKIAYFNQKELLKFVPKPQNIEVRKKKEELMLCEMQEQRSLTKTKWPIWLWRKRQLEGNPHQNLSLLFHIFKRVFFTVFFSEFSNLR